MYNSGILLPESPGDEAKAWRVTRQRNGTPAWSLVSSHAGHGTRHEFPHFAVSSRGADQQPARARPLLLEEAAVVAVGAAGPDRLARHLSAGGSGIPELYNSGIPLPEPPGDEAKAWRVTRQRNGTPAWSLASSHA